MTRWYSNKEFAKLSHDTRAYILNHEDRIHAVNATRKKAKAASTTTDCSQTEEEANCMVSATITGTMRALEQRAAHRTHPIPLQVPTAPGLTSLLDYLIRFQLIIVMR